MADQEHLNLIKQSVPQWNEWIKQHPRVIPNLSEADLSGADLRSADLSGANLRSAKLSEADLSTASLSFADLRSADLRSANLRGTDLSGAELSFANLRNTKLSEANLHSAKLIEADLSSANLSFANLSGADLSFADLRTVTLDRAILSGADLSDARMGYTQIGDRNLREIKGLETVRHYGPSSLSINSVYQSEGNIPEVFVKGTGAPDTFVEYMRALAAKPIDYSTCFISYASKDHKAAERLYADLQSKGVRCWFAPEDLKGDDTFTGRIEGSIRLYDKRLVLLSTRSIASSWVENEVRTALEKEERLKREHRQDRTILFPIKLDTAIDEATPQWATQLRQQRHILDFTHWKRRDAYAKAFDCLLRDLKTEAAQKNEEEALSKDQRHIPPF